MLRILFLAAVLCAQQTSPPDVPKTAAAQDPDVEWICPMDKDVRSNKPGKCPRCGMMLVANLPEPREFSVQITTKPAVMAAGKEIELDFRMTDPDTHKPVREFEIMHERLFHLFVVSQDTKFFRHIHPVIQPDGSFRLGVTFPHAGEYRVLSDFYPKGATPQLIADTLFVPGEGFKLETAKLTADVAPKKTDNLEIELVTDPPQPLAGFKTLMFFKLKPDDGIEQYIGAWGHMLAASWDLIDMIHTHPFLVTDPVLVTDPEEGAYKQVQFNMIFPRAGVYRVWTQFQRKGVVNTVVFDVPVKNLE